MSYIYLPTYLNPLPAFRIFHPASNLCPYFSQMHLHSDISSLHLFHEPSGQQEISGYIRYNFLLINILHKLSEITVQALTPPDNGKEDRRASKGRRTGTERRVCPTGMKGQFLPALCTWGMQQIRVAFCLQYSYIEKTPTA